MHTVDPTHAATAWVCDYVAAQRGVCGSVKAACAAAARYFDISPRRALSYWWRQVGAVQADEFLRLQKRHHARLRLERMRTAQELAALDALIATFEDTPNAALDGPPLAGMAALARQAPPLPAGHCPGPRDAAGGLSA